jgi:hypothetical protein
VGFRQKEHEHYYYVKEYPQTTRTTCKAVYRPAIWAWDKTKMKHTEVKTIHQAVQGPRSVNVPKTTNKSKNKQKYQYCLKIM